MTEKIKEVIYRCITPILSPEQKQEFRLYYPDKVYKTERNISLVVTMTQVCMILLFVFRSGGPFENKRTASYFMLYVCLLAATCAAFVFYRFLLQRKKYLAFFWLRRGYVFVLCAWVIGITLLEQMGNKGLGVYCYLLPTLAAVLLLTPTESVVIFGMTWSVLAIMLVVSKCNPDDLFGNLVNSIFVAVLALFISIRYYRSMAMEFRDRGIIEKQYEKIQENNEELNRMVFTDQLTGLYNRHYLTEQVYNLIQERRSQYYCGALLMLDIDYFKQYNDSYGHLQGDQCLKRVAAILRQECEKEQMLSIRFGGEEFLMIQMQEQLMDVFQTAERVRIAIRESGLIRTDNGHTQVTVSIGCWQGRLTQIPHLEAAIKYADEALYDAKNSGRDRTCRSCSI